MCVYTYILISLGLSTRGPGSRDTSIAMTTSNAQILVSKYHITWKEEMEKWLMPGLIQGKYKKSLEYLVYHKEVLKEQWGCKKKMNDGDVIKGHRSQLGEALTCQIWDNSIIKINDDEEL